MLWYTGYKPAKLRITLPAAFAESNFEVRRFDSKHNNPAVSGEGGLAPATQRNAADLILNVEPKTLLLISSP